jgi:DNA (cytosine-5)-methyltransferase 1
VVSKVSVIDLFAGPGGLGEGFSAYSPSRGFRPFNIELSVEKEASAHKTLELRAFFRQFEGSAPDEYYSYLKGKMSREDLFSAFPTQSAAAIEETLGGPRALGDADDDKVIQKRLKQLRSTTDRFVLIGGPPCQAYSLVGRARNKGNSAYRAEEDHRHFLYREYLNVLHTMQPEVFVMENVKGILSSKINGQKIFPTILEDLSNPAKALGKRGGKGYRIHSLVADTSYDLFGGSGSDYIIKAENYGIPQARHRVILLGIRGDINKEPSKLPLDQRSRNTGPMINDLPRLRSGLSKETDSSEDWYAAVTAGAEKVRKSASGLDLDMTALSDLAKRTKKLDSRGSRFAPRKKKFRGDEEIGEWYLDEKLGGFVNHESRGHIVDDLARYFFCSLYAQQKGGSSPRAGDFPRQLAPKHANWKSGNFVDRFKVQSANKPSSTITSHISKDGHYFIHPDPSQCRSLTVREAGRLQTFPDNYLFEGNRTQQYVQVGNAVPPYLARQIAAIVYEILV